MSSTVAMQVPQNPIILRCHRIMEAFAKSDDERDFYLDRKEGYLVYVDLDKSQEELDELTRELEENKDRYVAVPKLTFYEVKKLMEGFVNEKVYDIDTKEKLLDIIQSKEARENFLEFIYDHHSELEKWQQYYQERFRVRIIEWLRNHTFDFVFEEDIELTKSIVERVKINMFNPKVSKDIVQARKILAAKAATYYSNEALNPRPKRGRPPKQVVKVETEPQFSQDIYITPPRCAKPFLFTPDYHSSSMIFTFSGKFTSEADLLAHRRQQLQSNMEFTTIGQKLAAIRTLSSNSREGDTSGGSSSFGFNEALGQMEASSAESAASLKSTSKRSKRLHAEDIEGGFGEDDLSLEEKRPSSSKARGSAQKLTSSARSTSSAKKNPAKKATSTLSSNRTKVQSSTKTAKASSSSSSQKKSATGTLSKAKQTSGKATKGKTSTAKEAAVGKPNSKQKIRLRPLIRKTKKS